MRSPWCDHCFSRDNVALQPVTFGHHIDFFRHFTTFLDVSIKTSPFFKTLSFPVLLGHALSLSLTLPRVLKHYNTLLWYFATSTVYKTCMCFIFTATGAIAESTENALYGCIYSACWQFWHLRVYIFS